jgi:hypothetical protein
MLELADNVCSRAWAQKAVPTLHNRRAVGWAQGHRAHANAPSMLELADIVCSRAWAQKAVPTLHNRRAVGGAQGHRAHANAPSMLELADIVCSRAWAQKAVPTQLATRHLTHVVNSSALWSAPATSLPDRQHRRCP